MNMDDVYTMLPGEVVSYDGKMAVVRLGLAKLLSNGQTLAPPTVANVPVKFPVGDGGKAMITVPLKPGDPVECTFSCRSLENWLSGSNEAPDDPRQFDISDAFCTPVLRPPLMADTENLVVAYGPGGVKIGPDGTVKFYGPGVEFDAPVSFQQSVEHQGVSIGKAHAHSGVSTGGGTTGEVVP